MKMQILQFKQTLCVNKPLSSINIHDCDVLSQCMHDKTPNYIDYVNNYVNHFILHLYFEEFEK